jgi:hypothetical protein
MRAGKAVKTRSTTPRKHPGQRHCRREYDFALVLDGLSELDDGVMNKLFEAGCGDATFSVRYGLVVAEFSREAENYPEAVLAAIRDIRAAGADVLRVNTCDLVTPADIARRIDRSRELVSQYIRGERGPGTFPPPECFLADDKPLWMWCAVSHWLAENQIIRPEEHREALFVWVVNEWLSTERARRESPELLSQVQERLGGQPTPATRSQPRSVKVAS